MIVQLLPKIFFLNYLTLIAVSNIEFHVRWQCWQIYGVVSRRLMVLRLFVWNNESFSCSVRDNLETLPLPAHLIVASYFTSLRSKRITSPSSTRCYFAFFFLFSCCIQIVLMPLSNFPLYLLLVNNNRNIDLHKIHIRDNVK